MLGGGPAGLTAAWRAALAGHHVVVHEREDRVGGLAGSFDVGGVRVDHGSHRLHAATDPAVLAELRRLLGDELQWRPRRGRIRLEGRWVRFPLSLPDLVRRLPPGFVAGVAADALASPLRRARADTFAEVVRAGLGPTMLGRFYGPYARKLWGEAPEGLAGEQARRRIAALTPAALVRKALRPSAPPCFWYPAAGFGRIVERLAEAAAAAGAEIRLGSEVGSLGDVAGADVVWSTIPVTALARIGGGPSTTLRFRSLVLVYLVLDRAPWTSWDAHYLPGPETPVSRLSEPRNYRASSADPIDRTVLCAEIPCAAGDDLWAAGEATLGRLVAEAAAGARLPPVDPIDVVVRRVPVAYPVYDVGFEDGLAEVRRWLSTLDRVVSFGRNGLFAHDNTHHALAEAFAAADCLGPDGAWDAAAWSAVSARFAAHVVED